MHLNIAHARGATCRTLSQATPKPDLDAMSLSVEALKTTAAMLADAIGRLPVNETGRAAVMVFRRHVENGEWEHARKVREQRCHRIESYLLTPVAYV